MGVVLLLGMGASGVAPRSTAAQSPPPPAGSATDTLRALELEAVVVTAERTRAPLITSTAAVSRISSAEIRRLPLRSLADALQQAPGLAFLDFDGLGNDPQLTVRGFYGGGEAEYVAVLLNGVPLNDAETGLFNWDLVPLSAIESVEVVRGGASSLYGDAAIGGVINLITTGAGDSPLRFALSGGEFGNLRGSAALRTRIGGREASVFGGLRRTEGFREHAERTAGTVGGSLSLMERGDDALSLSVLSHGRSIEEPGPLSGAAVGASRAGVLPFFRFDRADERLHRLALNGRAEAGAGASVSGYLAGELRGADAVRTLLLSPDFADTKRRDLSTARLLGSTQVQIASGPLPGDDPLLIGVEGSWGTLETEYHALLGGDADAYRNAELPAGEVDTRGEGARGAAAGFLRYEVRPSPAVRLSAGARLDWIRDVFEPLPPSDGERTEAEHLAFSPQAGVNVRYVGTARHAGHLFANVGRSFKAPTPDQLFDQRTVPVPFPPYAVAFSNVELNPQYGTGIEAGLYHRAELVPRSLAAELSLAAYQIDMRDELDFDLQTLRYVNIGRSRHRGVETGLRLLAQGGSSAFVNYTLQAATARFGEHEGRFLKAIPRHFLRAGASAEHGSGLAGGVTATSAWGIYLDDANAIELPGYTRVDAGLSYPVGRMRLSAEVFNLFDRTYSTTGFPDPAGTDEIFYFPAAGRMLQVGVTVER